MGEERPVDVIRRMNPGVYIPTGVGLAEEIKEMLELSEPKMVKCPGCEITLPADDLDSQVAHMDACHPNIIAERRRGL